MDMVERVANAIFDADNTSGVTWEDNTKDWERDDYRKLSRAAILAMREPTNEMIDAGDMPKFGIRQIWQAMIDAILKKA